MYEPIELEINSPEDAIPLSMSPTNVRKFMGQVNRVLAREHQLPGRSPEVVNAILANAIDAAQQAGDTKAEYDAWAVVDDLTYRTITETNNAREAVGLGNISHHYRQQLIWTAERYATVVHDYDEDEKLPEVESIAQQSREIQDEVLGFIDNGVISIERGFGIMLLLDAVPVKRTADAATIHRVKEAASKDIYVRIFNQQVRTPDVSALEMVVQYGEPNHSYVSLKDIVDRYKEMFPSEKFETPAGTYIRL